MTKSLKIEKLAHALKLPRPVAPTEESERRTTITGVKEVRRMEECVPYHSAYPTAERLRAGRRCYAVPNDAGEVESLARMASRQRCTGLGTALGSRRRARPTYTAAPPSPRRAALSGGRTDPQRIVWGLTRPPKPVLEARICRESKAHLRALGEAGFEGSGSGRIEQRPGLAWMRLGRPRSEALEQA